MPTELIQPDDPRFCTRWSSCRAGTDKGPKVVLSLARDGEDTAFACVPLSARNACQLAMMLWHHADEIDKATAAAVQRGEGN